MGTPNQMIIDVRTAGDFHKGSVTGAVNIPMRRLQLELSAVSRNTRLVFIDTAVESAAVAAQYAFGMGFANTKATTLDMLRNESDQKPARQRRPRSV